MAAKVKALQQWCKTMCEGYRDVDIRNMTSSWKSGLAFCAIIHRYRPDLIDFDSLSKENVYENNKLAFDIALDELGIPALLDAEDMVAMAVPDKLCIITYVSQYYNYFHNKSKMGGPDVRKRVKRQQSNESPCVPDLKKQAQEIPLNEKTPEPQGMTRIKRNTFGEACTKCAEKVYIMERHFDKGKLFHRRCFRELQRSERTSISPIYKATHSTAEKMSPTLSRYLPYSDVDPERKAAKTHLNDSSSKPNESGVKSKIAQFSRPGSPANERHNGAWQDSDPKDDGYMNNLQNSPCRRSLTEGRLWQEIRPNRGLTHSPKRDKNPSEKQVFHERKRSSSNEKGLIIPCENFGAKGDRDKNISQNAILHGHSKASAAMKAFLKQDLSHSDISESLSVELRHSTGGSKSQICEGSRLSEESRAVFAKYGVTFSELYKTEKPLCSTTRRAMNTEQSPKQDRIIGDRENTCKSTDKQSSNFSAHHEKKANGEITLENDPAQGKDLPEKNISTSYSENCIGQYSNVVCQLEPSTSDFSFTSNNDQAMMSGLLKSLQKVKRQHDMEQSKSDNEIHGKNFTTKVEHVQETDIDSAIRQKQITQGDADRRSSSNTQFGVASNAKLVKVPLVDDQSETKVNSEPSVIGDKSPPKWKTKTVAKTSPYTSPIADSPKSSKYISLMSRDSPREVHLNQPAGKSIMKTKNEDEGFDLSQFKKEGNKVLKDHKKQMKRENRKSKIMETLDSISPKSLLKKTNSYSPTLAEAKSAKSPEQSRHVLKSSHNTPPRSNIQTKSILKLTDGSTVTKSGPSVPQENRRATKLQNKPSFSIESSSLVSSNNYSAFNITDSVDLTRCKAVGKEAGSLISSIHHQKPSVLSVNFKAENPNNREVEQSYLNTNNSDSSGNPNDKDKKDERPKWMIEAERRKKTRGGKYDDPEKGYMKSETSQMSKNDDSTEQSKIKPEEAGKYFDALGRKKYGNETNNNRGPNYLDSESYETPCEGDESEHVVVRNAQGHSSGKAEWQIQTEKMIGARENEYHDPVKNSKCETVPPPKPKRAFEVISIDTTELPCKMSVQSKPEVYIKESVIEPHMQKDQSSDGIKQQKENEKTQEDLANANSNEVCANKKSLKDKREDTPETVAAKENIQMRNENDVTFLIKSQPITKPESNLSVIRKPIKIEGYKNLEFLSRGDDGKIVSSPTRRSPMLGEGDPYPSPISSKSALYVSTSTSDSPISDVCSTGAIKDTPTERNEKFITETNIDLAEPTDKPRKKVIPTHEFTFSFDSSVEMESPTNLLLKDSSEEGVVFGLVGRKKKKWTAPLPSVEKTTPKRKVNAETRLTTTEIQMQLNDLDIMLQQMEESGKVLEEKIRRGTDEAMDDEEDELMMKWFEMINEKNELVRKESELMYRQKQQDLEDRHEELEYQLRCIIEIPENQKTVDDKAREEELLQELLDIVALRNNIIDSIEEDRIRYIEEDKEITEVMQKKGFSRSQSEEKTLESAKSDEGIISDQDKKTKANNGKKHKKEKKEKKGKKKKKSF